MSDFITKLSELIDPEVMGDMVSARIPKKLRVAPFAKIDDTLQGVPGDTITVPAYIKSVTLPRAFEDSIDTIFAGCDNLATINYID